MSEISDRRIYTASRIVELRKHLKAADELISGRVCVYATGSFGRREASKYSDLDLFIVGKSTVGKDGEKISLLSRLSDICVKAELIATTRRVGIPDFDGDGKYLTH
jgi:UTP:GlnB (protein PII) uridylyltransferase